MTLVIGYGNPLRGCDKFGVELATALSKHFDTIITHQLTLDLVEKLFLYDTIIFADCAYGSPSLSVACSINDTISFVTHKTNLFDFINFAQIYCNKTFDFVVYSILCDRYDYGEYIDISDCVDSIKKHILEKYSTLRIDDE